MTPVRQWMMCCLNPEYYHSLTPDQIIFDREKYAVEHRDHWTDQPLIESELLPSPSFFPGVKQFYPANISSEKEARKNSRKLFDECEANCNTCRWLNRFAQPKDPQGFMAAICLKKMEEIWFHPEDPMFMKCYEGR